jgi:hypothetical protein
MGSYALVTLGTSRHPVIDVADDADERIQSYEPNSIRTSYT